ncbi:hypothetical protein DQ04_01801120 [Trypanosoma grayi]|uniref:hypothetical protein n=1 Tax=Trypanosoma grayi TaxID=71804 RepID=UPI0004F40E1C|nr:hypothetical protein DQ04_01801120 [Trypanosoma grayi]KEG12327.1 hypothetical protein DQ04_01801120 [Trypanosoma grayi]
MSSFGIVLLFNFARRRAVALLVNSCWGCLPAGSLAFRPSGYESDCHRFVRRAFCSIERDGGRWLPSAYENTVVELLDKAGVAEGLSGQSVYSLILQHRLKCFGCPCPLPYDVAGCGEVLQRVDGSHALVCPVSCSSLMRSLVVPVEMRSELHGLLKSVLCVLDDAGIECWAAAGTLLGAVRNYGIIPWDDDVDIAIAAVDETKLRAAFYYPATDGESDLVLEYVPLFGYKVYSRSLPPPTQSGGSCCMRYGYFVDIFVFEEWDDFLVLARGSARKTWPNEWWRRDELFPLVRVPFHDVLSGAGRTLQLPVAQHAMPHLQRLYGAACMEEAVVPRELHGRLLSHPLHIPMSLLDIQ